MGQQSLLVWHHFYSVLYTTVIGSVKPLTRGCIQLLIIGRVNVSLVLKILAYMHVNCFVICGVL